MGTEIKLKNVRCAFPTLYEAKTFKDSGIGKPRFSVTLLIEKASLNDKLVREAIQTEAAAFGAQAAAKLKSFAGDSGKICYSEGDESREGFADMMVLACHSYTAPLTLGRNARAVTEQSGTFYAGCYVNVKASVWAQTKNYPGIRASFSGIQFAYDGEGFAGGPPATVDDFEDLSVNDPVPVPVPVPVPLENTDLSDILGNVPF